MRTPLRLLRCLAGVCRFGVFFGCLWALFGCDGEDYVWSYGVEVSERRWGRRRPPNGGVLMSGDNAYGKESCVGIRCRFAVFCALFRRVQRVNIVFIVCGIMCRKCGYFL